MNQDRVPAAASHRAVVIATEGLLAVFNDAGVLEPIDVIATQTLARICGETDERAMLAAAMTLRGTRFGHVCIQVGTLRDAVVVDGPDPDLVDTLPWPDPEEWTAAVAGSVLVGDGSGDEPLVLHDDRLYLERYFRYEEHLATLITNRCRRQPRMLAAATETMLQRLLGPGPDTQPTRQHQAAVLAATNNLAVITGGPGTGKTYTVGALLAALAADTSRPFPLVAVCAPTGKAAARLGEALTDLAASIDDPAVTERLATVDPSTIHRLLGWAFARGQFAHHARRRLPHDLVVVDEMSMVSMPMAAKLLQAVGDDATLVLVGDPFQLESIEAGTVLADIAGPTITPDPTPAASNQTPIGGHLVTLDRTHRFAETSVISRFADAVRHGDSDSAIPILERGHDALRWVKGRDHPGFRELWDTVIEHRSRLVEIASTPGDLPTTLTTLGEVAVLCARRSGSGGVGQWQQHLETSLDEKYPGLRYHGPWYPGRPIMITRNDYTLNLYNGDIGVAAATADGLRAIFDRGGIRTLPLSHLGEHTTVHAMTVHKSQGSQFDTVIVALPDQASPLLTRQLLYTAITRATTRVWLLADEATLRQSINRSVQRASGLAARLWS